MSSEDNRLQGEVPPELLEERERFPVSISEEKIWPTLEMPVYFDDPFKTNAHVFVPTDKPLLFEHFIELAEQVVQNAQQNEQKTELVEFVGEYPGEDLHRLGDEVITWRLMRRAPARTGRAGGGTMMPQWQHSHSLKIPDSPDRVISIERRLVDNVVAFTCWSKSARLANTRALWLERLLINNTWVFQQKGADFFQWKDRGSDNYQTTGGVRLYYRTLQFDVRLPEFRIKADPSINIIETRSDLSS